MATSQNRLGGCPPRSTIEAYADGLRKSIPDVVIDHIEVQQCPTCQKIINPREEVRYRIPPWRQHNSAQQTQ